MGWGWWGSKGAEIGVGLAREIIFFGIKMIFASYRRGGVGLEIVWRNFRLKVAKLQVLCKNFVFLVQNLI